MIIGFSGGVEEIGSLSIVAESNETRILFDYGLTPSKPPKFPRKVKPSDALFLTHSHLDHIGMAPWVCGEYGARVYGTRLTLETALILLMDTIKIAKIEGYTLPYDQFDVRRFKDSFNYIEYGQTIRVGPFSVTAYDAGHIPGSTMYMFNDGSGTDILFTGDINTVDTRLQTGVTAPECDVLIMESTYSGRPHPDREKVESNFLRKIEEILERGGKVIIPAFAVGRTQEVIQIISPLRSEKWLHGMGTRVSKLYLENPRFLRDPKSLNRALRSIRFVKNPGHRAQARNAPIVVTTSGMLDGGPVLDYIENRRKDTRSGILLTGYQVDDTNGRMLMETGSIEIAGVIEKVDCEVVHYDFSAHAGHDQLTRFAQETGAAKVILVHGDDRTPLADAISTFTEVLVPSTDDTYEV